MHLPRSLSLFPLFALFSLCAASVLPALQARGGESEPEPDLISGHFTDAKIEKGMLNMRLFMPAFENNWVAKEVEVKSAASKTWIRIDVGKYARLSYMWTQGNGEKSLEISWRLAPYARLNNADEKKKEERYANKPNPNMEIPENPAEKVDIKLVPYDTPGKFVASLPYQTPRTFECWLSNIEYTYKKDVKGKPIYLDGNPFPDTLSFQSQDTLKDTTGKQPNLRLFVKDKLPVDAKPNVFHPMERFDTVNGGNSIFRATMREVQSQTEQKGWHGGTTKPKIPIIRIERRFWKNPEKPVMYSGRYNILMKNHKEALGILGNYFVKFDMKRDHREVTLAQFMKDPDPIPATDAPPAGYTGKQESGVIDNGGGKDPPPYKQG